MADVRSELAQLRPVYETGVLRMLLHKYSDIYIAMLRACFDPLTAEVRRSDCWRVCARRSASSPPMAPTLRVRARTT